ncbi:MAG: hypothetical protein ACREBG_09970 [Pyrinomonadaceae bacterium]
MSIEAIRKIESRRSRARAGSILIERSSMIIALASPCIASALDEGLDKIKRLLSEASAQGAEIVCFPEAYLPGLWGDRILKYSRLIACSRRRCAGASRAGDAGQLLLVLGIRTCLIQLKVLETEEAMKAYVITTGALFGLLTVAHILRIVTEDPHLAREPVFMLTTVASAALCIWAWRVVRRSNR